jgi:multisubunit Na+/H+ antiporter MnhC subunit
MALPFVYALPLTAFVIDMCYHGVHLYKEWLFHNAGGRTS